MTAAHLWRMKSFNDFQPGFAGGVDLRQMRKEFFCEQQGTVKGRTVVFQLGASHPAIFADVVLLRVSQYKVGDQIIPALCVGQFQNRLLCGNVWCWQLWSGSGHPSFITTVFSFATNEPQS